MLPEYCNFFKVVEVICFTMWTVVPLCISCEAWEIMFQFWRNQAPPQKKYSSYAQRCWNNSVGLCCWAGWLRHPEHLLQLSCCYRVWTRQPEGEKAELWLERNVGIKTRKERKNGVQFIFFFLTKGIRHFCLFVGVFLVMRRKQMKKKVRYRFSDWHVIETCQS